MPKKKIVSFTANQLASILEAQVIGDGTSLVTGLSSSDEADASDLAFVSAPSRERVAEKIAKCRAGILLISDSVSDLIDPAKRAGIVVPAPQRALIALTPLFFEPYAYAAGISERTEIDSSANIAPGSSVGAFTVIGPLVKIGRNCTVHPGVIIYAGVTIGDNVTIHSGAIIREDSVIGSNCVIQNGAVVGADGFGYIPDLVEGLKSVPQVGNVVLADGVEIGANSCIDRATLGSTTIGLGTKIDNLVQVGHNVKIGRHGIICGQAGIAGSCSLGDRVVLAGNVGVRDHITIGSDIRVGAKSGVLDHLKEPGDYMGWPIMRALEWKKLQVTLRTLRKRLKH